MLYLVTPTYWYLVPWKSIEFPSKYSYSSISNSNSRQEERSVGRTRTTTRTLALFAATWFRVKEITKEVFSAFFRIRPMTSVFYAFLMVAKIMAALNLIPTKNGSRRKSQPSQNGRFRCTTTAIVVPNHRQSNHVA